MGNMATSPLPYRGSPPLQSGGIKSEVAHKWAKGLPHPCRIGDPHRFIAGGKHENTKNTKKAKAKILQATGFEPRTSEISAKCYYQLSYARPDTSESGCLSKKKKTLSVTMATPDLVPETSLLESTEW